MNDKQEVPEERSRTPWHLLSLEISEEHDCCVGGEEDEDMPGSMEVGKANTDTPGTEEPVSDPADDCQDPEHYCPVAQAHHHHVLLQPQLVHQQQHGGDTQQQQDEGIHYLE